MFFRDTVDRADFQYRKGNLRRAADLYRKAKRFRLAAQIYSELGEAEKAVDIYISQGLVLEAAELLAAQGRHKEAISRFEEAGAYRKAAESSLEVNQLVRAGRFFLRARMFRQAADAFTKAGEVEGAVSAWQREAEELRSRRGSVRDHSLEMRIRQLDIHRADLLSGLGRYADAADLFVEHGLSSRAAPLYSRSNQFSKAAAAYLDAGDVDRSVESIGKARNASPELRAEIYLNCGRAKEAGEIFAEMGRVDAAASAFEAAEEWASAAGSWEQSGVPARAAEFFLKAGLPADAGRCFSLARDYDNAGQAFARAGDHVLAAQEYLRAGRPLLAGEHFLQADRREEARDALLEVPSSSLEYPQASVHLVPMLIDDGNLEGARHRFDSLTKGSSRVSSTDKLYCIGRLAEADGKFRESETAYQKILAERRSFRDVVDRLDKLVDTRTRSLASQSGSHALVSSGSHRLPDALDSIESSATLPFELLEQLPSWWSDAPVWLSRDQRSHERRQVVCLPDTAPLPEAARDFDRARRLEHSVIVAPEELLVVEGKGYWVCSPVPGRQLETILAKSKLSPSQGIQVLAQLADGLSSAHKLGLSHGWVSPQTVYLDDDMRVRLVGFGLEQVVLASRPEGQLDESSVYRSSRDHQAGPANDVHSLGWLAAELLQARLPPLSEMSNLDPGKVSWSRDVLNLTSSSMLDTILACLEAGPLERPSMAEVAAALNSAGLAPGQVLADRYEIVGEIGRGGMSRVYRATDRELADEVAIKTVLTPALGRSEDGDRLLREVQICRKITHPNVVRVHDFGRFPSGIFVIMELLVGPGLDQVIKSKAPMRASLVKRILIEITAALAEAHRLEIIHRDLKPANVILSDPHLKVLDFGIARKADGTDQLTRTGEVIGSPLYMAPEQIQGLGLTAACDLYSLGVIAYTMLAGREPFKADTATAVVLKHLHEPPPDVSKARPDLDPEWAALITRLMAKEPGDRYGSAVELGRKLQSLPDS